MPEPTDNLFAEKIARYQRGLATEAEKKEIEAWLESLENSNAYKGVSVAERNDSKNRILHKIYSEIQPTEGAKGKRVVLSKAQGWAAAAAIAMLCIAALWLFRGPLPSFVNRDQSLSDTNHKPAAQTQSVFTGKQFVKLTDGTSVLLNDHSELRIESGFNGNERKVSLTGEAFFDVAHDPTKPFSVVTGKVITTVLGTAFNVNSHDTDVRVTVARGKVQVGDANHIYGLITPNQQIAVNTTDNTFVKSETKSETVTAWKKDFLILEDVTMEAAAMLIMDRFNAKIVFDHESLKRCRFSATFMNGESLTQVLNVITGVNEVTYEQLSDGTIKIKGEGCE